jgi:hypothetical protein
MIKQGDPVQEEDTNWVQWLTPTILVTSEAEIGRIKVRGQPGQIVHKTPSPK